MAGGISERMSRFGIGSSRPISWITAPAVRPIQSVRLASSRLSRMRSRAPIGRSRRCISLLPVSACAMRSVLLWLVLGAAPEVAFNDTPRSIAAILDLDCALADDGNGVARLRGVGGGWVLAHEACQRCWRGASGIVDLVTEPGQPGLSNQRRHADGDGFAQLLPGYRQIAPQPLQLIVWPLRRKLTLKRGTARTTEPVFQRVAVLACGADPFNHAYLHLSM